MFGFGTKIESININEINGVIKTTTIDVRNKNEVLRGHIKGTKNIPMDQLLAEPSKYLKNDKKYLIEKPCSISYYRAFFIGISSTL